MTFVFFPISTTRGSTTASFGGGPFFSAGFFSWAASERVKMTNRPQIRIGHPKRIWPQIHTDENG
jgi:hypothetical protein